MEDQATPVPNNPNVDNEPLEDESLQVQATAQELEQSYNSDTERNVSIDISGSAEEASRAHTFLFTRALQKATPQQRRLYLLAQLLLEKQHNQTNRVRSPYGDHVGRSGERLADVFSAIFYFDQALKSGQEIAKGMQGQKLKVEMDKIQELFVKFGESYLKYLSHYEINPTTESKTKAAIMAAQEVTREFFGFPNEHSAAKNGAKYTKEPRSLEEFHGDQSAVCTEYTLLTQQLLSLAGLKTRFISGGPMMAGSEEGEFGALDYEGHTFNLIFDVKEDGDLNKAFLFDAVNPGIVPNPNNPEQTLFMPYLAPLTRDETISLLKGKNLHLQHLGQHRLYMATA